MRVHAAISPKGHPVGLQNLQKPLIRCFFPKTAGREGYKTYESRVLFKQLGCWHVRA